MALGFWKELRALGRFLPQMVLPCRRPRIFNVLVLLTGCSLGGVPPRPSICPVADTWSNPAAIRSQVLSGWEALYGRGAEVGQATSVERIVTPCSAVYGEEYYFRRGVFYPSPDHVSWWPERHRRWVDAHLRTRFSAYLHAMGEPSLSCGEHSGISYRLGWYSTWEAPIAVRVGVGEYGVTLDAVELTGRSGFELGVPSCRVKRVLSLVEQQRLVDALKKVDFWALPTVGGEEGVDGTRWVIEGRTPDAYHVVDRWSPSGGAYLELGKLFLELAGYRER